MAFFFIRCDAVYRRIHLPAVYGINTLHVMFINMTMNYMYVFSFCIKTNILIINNLGNNINYYINKNNIFNYKLSAYLSMAP